MIRKILGAILGFFIGLIIFIVLTVAYLGKIFSALNINGNLVYAGAIIVAVLFGYLGYYIAKSAHIKNGYKITFYVIGTIAVIYFLIGIYQLTKLL